MRLFENILTLLETSNSNQQVRQKTHSNVWDTFARGSYANLQAARKKRNLSLTYKDMLIVDVFTRQMASGYQRKEANMTKYYQALDLTVKGHAKRCLKYKFST